MSIRLRYYLAILPLFLGVALINGLLVFTLDRQEIRWGLEQRAQGAAAVLAGFWPTLAGESPERQRDKLKAFSRRLGGLAIDRLLPTADGWQRETLLAREGLSLPLPGAHEDVALRSSALAWTFVAQPAAAADLTVGYAPLAGADGSVQAVLAVGEADTSLREATAALVRRMALLSTLLLLGGAIVAEWLTRFARRELGALNAAARQLADGHYLQHWPNGRIRELNDLGGTLLTMTSLLADGSHQTRRRFFEAELLPGDADLAACLRQSTLPRELPEALAARCAWRAIGEPLADEFFGFVRGARGWVVLAGLCRPDARAASELQRTLRATAARDVFLGLAQGGADAAAWERALQLFPCLALQWVHLADAGPAEGWALDPLCNALQGWQPKRRFALLGTLPREALRLARAYEGQFPRRALPQAMDEITGLLAGKFRGILVICEAAAEQPRAEVAP
jgi:hypothetical protein